MAYLPTIPLQIIASNSTTTPLAGNAVFTGTAIDTTLSPIASIQVNVIASVASAASGLQLQFSSDGTNWDNEDGTTVVAATPAVLTSGVYARYFRVVYTNGAATQVGGYFRLQTTIQSTPSQATTKDFPTSIAASDNALLTHSVIAGKNAAGTYTDATVDTYGSVNVSLGDSPNQSAFSRLRTAEIANIFDSDLQYNLSPNFWQSVLANGGTAASVANQSSCLMTVTSTTNSSVVRQTYKYFRYQPGKSQLIIMTGVMGAVVANVTKHIGYFDAQNGVGFYQDGTNTGVFVRTFTSGSAVDTLIPQSSWNVDKMDGTGPSGITVDWSKTQIFVIDLQWLGVGRVRYGLDINGQIYYVHYRNNANSLTTVYMSSANLPVRYDITNGAGGAGATMTQICSSVMSEGGQQITNGRDFSASNGVTTIAVTTRRAILSIQPTLTFNSITNRTDIAIQDIEIYSDAAIYWELVYGNTNNSFSLGGTPSFNPVASGSGGSAVQFDVAGTTVTGGFTVTSGYVSSAKQGSMQIAAQLSEYYPFGLDAAGANPNTWSIVVTSLSGTANCAAAMSWTERR